MIRPARGNAKASPSSTSSYSSSNSSGSRNGEGRKINGDRECRNGGETDETNDAYSQKTDSNDKRAIILGRNRNELEHNSTNDCGANTGSRPSSKTPNGNRIVSYNDIASGRRVLKDSGTNDREGRGKGESSSRIYGSAIDISNNRGLRNQERTSSDSKKRFTSTGSGSTSTTRYTRPSYTTTVSSTPLASSSMSPGLESSAGPDYKALYEAEKSETTQLRTSISAKQKQLDEIRLQLEDTRKAHHPADPDQRKAERQISDREEEMKVLEALRAESEKLKAEHRALTRVVSHLM
uniref:Protein phosphatase 1 regulatory subunit 12A n=1 Tax=Schistocephalus solidus TaxID=70667 RepID=A0A0X3PPM1_SCHSO